jgi:DNA-binding MarR family transcriptional regulator
MPVSASRRGQNERARPLTLADYLYIKVMTGREARMGHDRLQRDAGEVLRDCIATRLRLAGRVITKVYDDALRPLGLTVTQMSMLAVAEGRGLLRQSEVGAELHLDDSTLSRNLERMRVNGWLEGVPADDARVHSYRLTAAGRALLGKAVPAWRGAQAEAGRLLGGAGVRALRRFAREQGFGG